MDGGWYTIIGAGVFSLSLCYISYRDLRNSQEMAKNAIEARKVETQRSATSNEGYFGIHNPKNVCGEMSQEVLEKGLVNLALSKVGNFNF